MMCYWKTAWKLFGKLNVKEYSLENDWSAFAKCKCFFLWMSSEMFISEFCVYPNEIFNSFAYRLLFFRQTSQFITTLSKGLFLFVSLAVNEQNSSITKESFWRNKCQKHLKYAKQIHNKCQIFTYVTLLTHCAAFLSCHICISKRNWTWPQFLTRMKPVEREFSEVLSTQAMHNMYCKPMSWL